MENNKYYREKAWWVSPYNFEEAIRGQMKLPDKVEIHDATLRDGEQTPGVVFSITDKIRIAEGLMEVGVERIEAGMPAVSENDRKAVKEICRRKGDTKIYTFARAMKADIDLVSDCGADGVLIEIPIGYPKLKYQFNWTWEDVLEKSIDSINYAKEKGLNVVYFPYDTTRAAADDLENLLTAVVQDAKPDSIGLVDTMGCALPQTIAYMVHWMKKLTRLPIEVHTHNDFGMAVATELAGITAGASVVHTCVNGLGERTGNAALEEMILAMHILLGMDTAYREDKLLPLCKTVEKISRIPIAGNKPVSGERNYCRESGIGIEHVIKSPLAMFATDPVYFGRQPQVVLGKKSGKASVEYMLAQEGAVATEAQVLEILERVKALSEKKGSLIRRDEFVGIMEACIGSPQ